VRPSDLAVIARIRADLKSGAALEAREGSGISAGEVAETVGVSRSSVNAWEAGRTVPSAAHALAYARTLAAVAR
jgi:DNA-binding XRE family transcriptional regulator